MTGIMWKREYEVGIAEIDAQHQRLVGMIQRLQESLDDAGTELGGPIVGEVLKELVAYTQEHFRFEEEYMARIHYSSLEEHKQAHRRLLGEVRTTLLKLKRGEELTKIELIEFLKHWLIDHILSDDKRIGRELRQRLERARSGL